MNLLRNRFLISGILMVSGALSLNAALTKDFYTTTSVLSSGNWVKVGVDKTGVYEISYEMLREMGFSDPSKVSVYGRGGRILSESFVTNAGIPILTDDLTAVKVLHENNTLYFYGLGPEEITFETNADYSLGGYFRRMSNNIYTYRGYYFLTDSKDVVPMSVKNYESSSSTKLESGVSYVYHELDSVQNTTQSGQLFWGERIGKPGSPERKWDVTMPDAIKGDGVMHCEMYFPDIYFGANATVSYGFKDTEGYFKTPYQQTGALYYSPHNPTVGKIQIPGDKGSVFVGFNGEEMGDYSNLDFWVVSYRRSIPTMTGPDGERINQQLIAFPTIAKNSTQRMELANSASLVVLDVSTVTDPQRLQINQLGATGIVGVHNTSKTPVLVVFDKDRPQYQICGYEKAYTQIENQNLHSYKNEGADFIIITTPALRSYAEEIARLHREHDGIKVVVATTEECYNEFSGGVPDPMAYRSFARMLYFNDRKPKNMLLFGPLYGDFRGLLNEHDPADGIIAYQSPSISLSRGAHNINDFYGMMSDKFRTDYYERNDVHIGVGILPVKFDSEAKIVVDKIRNFLEREDHAYYFNRYTAIGGVGDEHTHDTQVRDISNHVRLMDNSSTVITPLAIDTYGSTEAQKKLFNQLNEGCNMFSYFGHGAEQFMGKDRKFFNAGDVFKLRNKVLPLALFGGCQITNTDRGFRGLGETLVTATEYGCIGSVVSARDTWSGQNYEFFKQFFTCLYTQGSATTSARRTEPVTIGEVYASLKHYSTYSNELSYQLLCDPALIFPIPNRSVNTDISGTTQLLPGEKFTIKGSIPGSDGNIDKNFNGEIVVRLAEPEKTIAAGCVETGQDPKNLEFTYGDTQVSMAVGEVKNGEFKVEIHAPGTLSNFTGEEALVYFAAYDPKTKVGAGKCYPVSIGTSNFLTSENKDLVPPTVEQFSFSEKDCSISFKVSDNLALNLSNNPLNKGVYLFIDGKERTEGHVVEPQIESGRPAFSKEVYIDGLTYGTHSARIKVKDAAGNSTEQEIVFTYSPNRAKYVIARSEESNADYTRIKVEGASPATSTLVVLSSEGTEVWRGACLGNAIEWDHRDTTGAKVAPGHYKAYLIETGSGMQKGHSEPIDIPVI